MVDFILYGAYGYTGQLITKMAEEYGLRPLLAGRSEEKLQALSVSSGYPYRVVDLADRAALEDLLQEAPAVLHAAGPFIKTASAMMDACLATGTQYLDITGEIQVFAKGAKRDEAAKAAGIMIMPGVGFDVVPTDCMAAFLHEKMPDATHLQLAFAWKGGGVSHGTAKTMLMGMGYPGAIRKDGKIQPVKSAYKTAVFPFSAEKSLQAVTIPWGDVFTAYYTTGIPNIETYFAAPMQQQKMMGWANYLGPILRLPIVKKYLSKKIDAQPAGPSDTQRAKARAFVYGAVRNAKGEQIAARIETLEGYTLTAVTALMITKKVLAGEFKTGYQTPAGCYGADLIMEVSTSSRTLIS